MISIRARAGAGLAIVILLLGAASALAAPLFTSGASYTGRSATCVGISHPPAGTTCTFKFRASKSGTSLRFVGTTVLATWGCSGGGGEALLGGTHQYADPIPLIGVGTRGALHGSAGQGKNKITVTGRLAANSKTVSLTFHLINQGCATQLERLTRR